jgi:hypothetical protein
MKTAQEIIDEVSREKKVTREILKRTGKKSNISDMRIPNIRHLSRIILYLSEVEEFAVKTRIGNTLRFGNQMMDSALKFLVDYEILEVSKKGGTKYYSLNKFNRGLKWQRYKKKQRHTSQSK